MKRLYNTVALTGMLTLAFTLSACSSWRDGSIGNAGSSSGSSSTGATSSSSPESPASSTNRPAANGNDAYPASDQSAATNATDINGASGASGAAGATGSSTAWQETPSQRAGAQTSASTTPNGTVISIEPLATSSSSGSSTSGATGSTSGSGAEQAYRITLRMDDGSTQVISQSSTPTYRSGDRVNLSSGVISR